MTQIKKSTADSNLPTRPLASSSSSVGNTTSDPSTADIKSLVEQWTEIFEECLQKLSDGERKKLHAFDRENLATSLGHDFREWKLPDSVTIDVRPFFEHAKILVQKLQEALKLPGQQPQLKSELLDGGGYIILWVSTVWTLKFEAEVEQNSSADQEAVKKARSLLKFVVDHISNLHTLTSVPLEQYSRPLTESCIAIIQLLSISTVYFGKHALDPNTLEKKLRIPQDRFHQDMEEAIKALQIRMQFLSSDSESITTQPLDKSALPKSDPVWMNTPSLQHGRFVGRERDLESVEKFFSDFQRSKGPSVAMFYGMGGVGKTTLAMQYYETQRTDSSSHPRYSYGFWINAESQYSVDQSLHDMALSLRLPVSNAQEAYVEVMRWLNTKANKHQWLIVLDNVDVTDPDEKRSKEKIEMFQKLMPTGSGHVIVTTRYFFQHAIIRGFHILKLDPEESLLVFNTYRRLYNSSVDTSTEEEHSRELLERFDGLPLAMKVAARYINDLGGVKIFLDEYVALEDEFLEENDSMSLHQKLNTIWELPFTRLSNESYSNARKLFGILCLMAADDIPVQELFSPNQALDADFKFLESGSRLERMKSLRGLRDLGLIDVDNLSSNSATIHRVLSAAFRNSTHGLQSADALQLAADTAAIILNRLFPKHEGSNPLWEKWDMCSKYMKHIEALVQIFEESEQKSTITGRRKLKSSKAMDELMKSCSWYQVELGKASGALKLLDFAEKISLDKESKEYATICQGYACVYLQLNHLKECEKWNKECLRIRQIHLDENDPDIANCRSNLANLFTAIGQFEDARNLISLAMKPLSEDRREDRSYLAMRWMMMGRTYLRERQLDDAERWFDKARPVLESLNAAFMLLFLAVDQGNLALQRKQFQEALKYFESGQTAAERDQAKHPIAGVLSYKTSLAYFHLGDYAAARKGLDEVIERARLDHLSGACKLSGQEPRALRLKAQIFAQDPKATDAERVEVLELEERATRLKNELSLTNRGIHVKLPETEQEEFDRLLSGYYQ